ncbi:MAG: tetratricopeptide repeat protein [Acidobacteriota bacterium]
MIVRLAGVLAFALSLCAADHASRGMELLDRKDAAGAIVELRAALREEPGNFKARRALAYAYAEVNDLASAIAELRRCAAQRPGSAGTRYELGLALGQSGELERAAAEFRRAVALDPKFAPAHHRLGVALRRMGDEAGALREFQTAVRLAPGDPQARYDLGMALKSREDLDGAVAAFREALRLKPDFEKARYALGQALRAQGQGAAASKELKEIAGLQRFRQQLAESKRLILDGAALLDKGDADGALERFEQAAKQSPTLPTAWHFLGVTWEKKGDAARALEFYNKALELKPDYAQTHLSLGLFYARRHESARAGEEFRAAVAGDPDYAEAHYDLGLVLAGEGKLDEAVREYSEAIALKQDYLEARTQLGLALWQKGDLAGAARALRAAVARKPDFAEGWNNLGLVLMQARDMGGARAALERALAIRPDYAEARYNLTLAAPQLCEVTRPTASWSVPHAAGAGALNTDPRSPLWARAAVATIDKDCGKVLDYPELKTEVRGFWTDSHLYLLFSCPYRELNLFLPARPGADRDKLWDRDVVEVFLGDDWVNIRHYREFEIAPTGDRVDLAIDLDREGEGEKWNSGWTTAARIDERARVWYAAARIPLKSVSAAPVAEGTRWRLNLYRIDGLGADPVRHFLCWQQTCAKDRDPNHVPENFGTLVFAK